jgi:hypothetical protein
VNENELSTLFSALNEAVDVLDHHRRPDPEFIAAFDTLKQARAMIEKVYSQPAAAAAKTEPALAAA